MARAQDPQDPDQPESFSERLKQKYGEGVDPGVSIGGEPSEAPSGATNELLKRLAEHGVKSPRYKLEGEVARGGMGAILRVWDEDLRRHLAMKVVLGKGDAPGSGATPQLEAKVLARFLEEAQVTGQLDHPGIVPVHELGLDSDGRVYFTMKLVKGRDLKAIFDLVFQEKEGWNETRALGVILKACEAMAYAHKKGVIHRDLKPANIMVGSFGEVFVMDWGLARVLGRKDTHDIRLAAEATPSVSSVKTERREEREDAPDSPLVTMDGDVMGTPAYMSPEQARGEVEKLSARSDVYSVGAMLYHLLARQMPYVPPGARVSNRTVLGMVLQGPPKPLHEINREVPVELVAICEKAMAREADRRYPDTLALAEDLRAYIEGRVVGAYETGTWAEARKWVQRNKPLAGACAAAVLAILIGAVSFAFKAEEANQRAVSEAEAKQAAIQNSIRAQASAREAQLARVDAEESARVARDSEETAKQREQEARASETRANRIAEFVKEALVSSDPNQGGSQKYTIVQAMDVVIRQLDSGALGEDPETQASLQETTAQILNGNGRSEDALRLAMQALATRQERFRGDHAAVARNLVAVALCLRSLGRHAEALPKCETAQEMYQRLYPVDNADVAASLASVAACLCSLGRSAEALPKFEAALRIREHLGLDDHPSLATSLNNVAYCLSGLGREEEALPKYEAALEMRQRLFRGDHPDIAQGLCSIGHCLDSLGRSAEALPKLEAARDMFQRLFQGDHPSVALSLNNLAVCLYRLGRGLDALSISENALDMRRRLFADDHPDVAESLGTLAACLYSLGRAKEAVPQYEAALEMRQRLSPDDHPDVAACLTSFGTCLMALGRREEALSRFEAALEMRQNLFSEDHRDVARGHYNVAKCLASLGRRTEALAQYEDALEMRQRLFKGDSSYVADSLSGLGVCLVSLGRSEEALPKFETALEMYRRLFQNDHRDIASALFNVAYCLQSLDRSSEALPYAEMAVEMAAKVLPESHPDHATFSKTLQRIRDSLAKH